MAATFCPDELMEMDIGMSDDEQLSAWLGGLPFLSVSQSEFNGSEAEVIVARRAVPRAISGTRD